MIYPNLPRLALSIRQPWAWLIVEGYKPIENRDWKSWNPGLKFRGEFAVHAGVKIEETYEISLARGYHPVTNQRQEFPVPSKYPTGGIVGAAEIIDVVTFHDSDYFVGHYGLVIKNARPVELIQVKGALGFFDWRKNLEPVHG
ncbi:ASCH domain-containing protein [Rhizobium azibense]|uniref:ASCH domain-containing protein n=1 Tax=Rhizobium azibense TaxID=1136135 RepID=A0A4R3RET3_9HYPH|nr:ASCH domain-containing protein [Rhizobium azibense]TCU34043.1 ASCH domain-containing protein [Rhizobium azibense]